MFSFGKIFDIKILFYHQAVFIVVGCKRDMASENLAKNREVSEEEARAFAHFNNLPYIETSSKTGKI